MVRVESASESAAVPKAAGIAKAATGIAGLDQVTNGGLPRRGAYARLLGAGYGKMLFAMESLLRGVKQYGEPGAFISFEEPESDLIENG
jgi:circadian clock protein KaiC